MRASGVIVAILLAAGTLGVFAALRDSGPASALRRFHAALTARDGRALAATLVQSPNDPSVPALVGLVQNVAGYGPPRILGAQRGTGEVRMVAEYGARAGQGFPIVFVLRREGGAWRIDARRTVTIIRDFLRMPPP